MKEITNKKIIVFGAAGLVGQNLCLRLAKNGFKNITGIDKNTRNLKILSSLNVCKNIVNADINNSIEWLSHAKDADVFVMAHAQISSLKQNDFYNNNVYATRAILDFLKKNRKTYLVHISSSVVNSEADDFYTKTKEIQENDVINSVKNYVVLRPTLMFGWFDRKHLGWLSRFMTRSPIFPIPGSGLYSRQPLYVGDFCNILIQCICEMPTGKIYDISGLEKIPYISMIKLIKDIQNPRLLLVHIPVFLFRWLLRLYGLFSKNPPFTPSQLDALIIPEDFPSDNWEEIFQVKSTPFSIAIKETMQDGKYSDIELEF